MAAGEWGCSPHKCDIKPVTTKGIGAPAHWVTLGVGVAVPPSYPSRGMRDLG